ncbi:conserved Plasmodium protein, unknown function [Plasmodium ovale]|uniref:Protein GPR89 n=1 Tax=Plasmodium ovale TaxID=36330 RepID=A0A1C3KXA7_PLAOA|nr:conserved Plasmodium protein, unknown function [Plasmodium ovale]
MADGMAISFLCVYHCVLLVLGSWFFENYLFRDFDNSLSLVKIIFCVSFVLCLSLLSMIVFEILGFITTTVKLFVWYIDITLLILFIYLVIPTSVIYTYVTYEEEKMSDSLFKFNYFYASLKKMKNKKINIPEEEKNNFTRRLFYVSEDLVSQMNSYNKKLKNRNKQKLGKFIIGCIFFLPLVWFTFYKVSMITLKNNSDVYGRSDIYDIDTILKEKLNTINKEFAEEYDSNNDKSGNFFFIKIMKNLLIYISVTGMTIVSALSAFTSLYSPYTNISNFFFFVTIQKVKIIEKKILFITSELSSKKKMLLLQDYPHLAGTLLPGRTHGRIGRGGICCGGSSCGGSSCEADTQCGDLRFPRCTGATGTVGSIGGVGSVGTVGSIGGVGSVGTVGSICGVGSIGTVGSIGGLRRVTSGGHRASTCQTGGTDETKRRGKQKGGICDWECRDWGCSETEYICLEPFRKCNLYLGRHKSICKDIYETFMQKGDHFDISVSDKEMEKRCTSIFCETEGGENNLEETREDYVNGCPHLRNTKESFDTTIQVSPFRGKIGSSNSLCRRNAKSKYSSRGESKIVNYKNRFIFFRTREGREDVEEEETDVETTLGGKKTKKEENSTMEKVNMYDNAVSSQAKEQFTSKGKEEKNIFCAITFYPLGKLFKTYDTLPYTIVQKENKSVARRYISAFLFNSFQKPLKTLKSVKQFFVGKYSNDENKKSKDMLIQDIKSLEYMCKKLYFLLDEVIKEQIRINQSTTISGIFLYILGIIMSILCIYKIVKTCYIIYMIEIHYRFISTYSSGHVLMLFYSKNINISFIHDIKNVLHIVHININLDNYVISITSVLLLCFIFSNLKTFMEKIIKLRYATKSSLYSNLAILLMCEIMDLYFSAYCIQLFDYLPVREKIKMLYIFFNNNVIDLFKLKYHFDFVYVLSLFISLLLIRLHHCARSEQFREV